MSMFDDYISALGAELGISLESECSHVAFEVDALTVRLRYDEDQDEVVGDICVYDIGENPTPQQQATLYTRCLEGQYCFGQTASFSLGLSPDDRYLNLQGQWKLGRTSDRAFIDSLEAFVQTAKLCVGVLQEAKDEETAAAPSDSGSINFDMLRV